MITLDRRALNIRRVIERDADLLGEAVAKAVRAETDAARDRARALIGGALSRRAGFLVTRTFYGPNNSIRQAGVVHSRWWRFSARGVIGGRATRDILAAHETGAIITPFRRSRLFIRLIGTGPGKRKLRLGRNDRAFPLPNGNALIVRFTGRSKKYPGKNLQIGVAAALLLRRVRLPSAFNLAQIIPAVRGDLMNQMGVEIGAGLRGNA